MSGTEIARKLLLAEAALFDAVPAQQVVVGVIPQGTPLPCIGITEVAATDRSNVRGYRVPRFGDAFWWGTRPQTKVTSLVQLTVMGRTYPECKQVMREARRALRDYVGDVGDHLAVTVRLAGQGPDFQTEEGIAAQTQDLRITFDESDIT
jgi:hypothetical protein